MAYEYPQPLKISRVAADDLSTHQFKFVKIYSGGDGDQVALVGSHGGSAADIPIGVLQNNPKAGVEAEICVVGQTKISGAADLTAGFPGTPLLVASDANGQAVAAVAASYTAGQMVVAPNGTNAIGVMLVDCTVPRLKA